MIKRLIFIPLFITALFTQLSASDLPDQIDFSQKEDVKDIWDQIPNVFDEGDPNWLNHIIKEIDDGAWVHFLEEVEEEYQFFISSTDPLSKLESISYDDRKKTVGEIRRIRKGFRSQRMNLGKDLKEVVLQHGYAVLDPFDWSKNQSPLIVQLIEKLVVTEQWGGCFLSPLGFVCENIEWHLNDENIHFLTNKKWIEPFSAEFIDEFKFYSSYLQPILNEYAIKSFLVGQKTDHKIAQVILELKKYEQLTKALKELLGKPPEDLAESIEWYDSEHYEAYGFMIDAVRSSWVHHFKLLNTLDDELKYLNDLLLGLRLPENEIEKEILPILKKYQNILSGDWKREYDALRYSYIID